MRALVHPQDAELVDAFLRVRPPGADVSVRLRMRGGAGLRLARPVAGGRRARRRRRRRETRFGAADQDRLTGLLDRSGFLAQAREALQRPDEPYELVVADLTGCAGSTRRSATNAPTWCWPRSPPGWPPPSRPRRCPRASARTSSPCCCRGRAVADAADALRIALEQPLRVAGFDIFPTMAVGAVEA